MKIGKSLYESGLLMKAVGKQLTMKQTKKGADFLAC